MDVNPLAGEHAAVSGPRSLPLIASSLELKRDPIGFFERIQREQGDVARVRLLRQDLFLLSRPADIEHVLVRCKHQVIKDWWTRLLGRVIGDGVLVTEGELWRSRRRLVQPAFHKERIEGYGEVMVKRTEAMVASFARAEPRDVHADMLNLTLEIVCQTLFGTDIGGDAKRIGEALEVLTHEFWGPMTVVLNSLPRLGPLRASRAVAKLDEVVYRMIRNHRRGDDRGDLLSLLLSATDEQGEHLNERALRDESVTMLLAGHETSALVLTFALYELARHPQLLSRVREEILGVVGDRPARASDVARLPLTEAVVKESMRLYPPVWAIGRQVVEEFSLGNLTIPRGAQVWMLPWTVHRDPRFHADPLTFAPDRWLSDSADDLPRFAYFPFGGGPRICIGNMFAMVEAVLVLATMLKSCTIAPTDSEPLDLVAQVTLRPRQGPVLQVRRVQGP